MHCLIIDDNTKTAEQLAILLEGQPMVTQVHKAVQPYLLRSFISIEPIAVMFMRVWLWNPAVFSTIKNLPPVVFLNGGRDKMTDQPGTMVPYKLREPYAANELGKLLTRITNERPDEEPGYFFVRLDSRYHRLFFRDIEMIERLKMGYLKIYTRYTTVMHAGTLSQYMQILPEGGGCG